MDAIELDTTVSALALAWVTKNPNTSTVILGTSNPEQVKQNLKALEVIPKLTPEVLEKIERFWAMRLRLLYVFILTF
jgi:aryl-alcohol dehydrogenase-like predicted oxidoreductase